MKNTLNKTETLEYVQNVFSKQSNPSEIIGAKKLAMSKNIKLRGLRKKFCKKCYSMFNTKNSEIRIGKGFKTIKCKCGYISRYKLK